MKTTKFIFLMLLCALFIFGCKDDVEGGSGEVDGDTDSVTDGDADSDGDTDTDTDADGDTDADTDADSDSDPLTIEDLVIQAECALDAFSTECLNVEGSNSELPDVDGWGGVYPSISSDGQVGYTNGGSWIAFPNIDLSVYNLITLNYTCAEGEGENLGTGFYVRLDSPDGQTVAFLDTGFTDTAWSVYVDTTAVIPSSITGSHTVYFVAAASQINNGNVDWIRFSYDSTIVETDTDTFGDGDLFIEAECALDGFSSACLDIVGSNSDLPDVDGWGGNYPSVSSTGQVGYTNGGSWIAFENIELTDYSKVTIHYACGDGEGQDLDTGFYVRLDAPDGTAVGILETGFTGPNWDVWVDTTSDLTDAATGVHTVYFVANLDQINNGNIDWIRFHN